MIRRRVVCTCSIVSASITDDARRALGWRLAPASVEPAVVPATDVFVWVCPSCADARLVRLRAS